MNHHQQNQEPAQASSNAMLKGKSKGAGRAKGEQQQEALTNAVTGASMANYDAIFAGFEAKGIDPVDVEPRVNVFTFNAWKALGRVVKRGESGVAILTVIERTELDKETGQPVTVRKSKRAHVFHITQTEPLDVAVVPDPELSPEFGHRVGQVLCDTAPELLTPPPIGPEGRPLNRYELRQEARRERYEERAASATQAASSVYSEARRMASAIPFGQPILVGHHSEGRDRRYRGRIHDKFRKSFELQDKAEHYEQKAASVGTGGISSDDPDAIAKLRAELESGTQSQDRMKAANKAIRSRKTLEDQVSALVALGFSAQAAGELVKPDLAGRVGFPDYALKNNNANIRRITGRIAELEKNAQRPDVERSGSGFIYREDPDENRVMFVFEGKPDEAARELLKAHGFNWSPSRDGKPWIRKLNNAGIWNGQRVFDLLNSSKNGDTE